MPVVAIAAPRPGPRPSSSRQEIVQCTIRMLDREGPEALTFRAVARELDVTVGALSRYFKNLADLEDEVAARIMSDLSPLDGKGSLRQQLLRLGMDLLEINRAHPYLLKIHGPASAAVVARHTRQSLKVLVDAGIDFDHALAIYALLGNLPYTWGAQSARRSTPGHEAKLAEAYMIEMAEFSPQIKALFADTSTARYRRWLLIYIDALLAGHTTEGKRR